MKLKLPKIKLFQVLLSMRYFYGLIVVVVIAVTGMLGLFLYKNLYLTIAATEEIILLKNEVAPDAVDIVKVRNILEAIDKKTTTTDVINWQGVISPFNPASSKSLEYIESQSKVIPKSPEVTTDE